MKFTSAVTINKPRDVVVQYFIDPNYLSEYQEGFIKKEHLTGEPQTTGATAMMYYDMGKRGIMELKEIILNNSLPDEFDAEYLHKHTENTMRSTFKIIDNGSTRFEAEVHYTAFHSWMLKIIAFLFPGMFKKQVQKWLDNFKEFVEKQV